MRIYVNLHFDYDYSNVILQGVFIPELKEYVRNVEWIGWDVTSVNKGASMLKINGNADDRDSQNHLNRTYVLLQRITDKYGEINIYTRDRRTDTWSDYVPTRHFTNEEMIRIEQEHWTNEYTTRIKWIEESIEKSNYYLSLCEEGTADYDIFKEDLDFQKDRLNSELRKEQDRLKAISTIWD